MHWKPLHLLALSAALVLSGCDWEDMHGQHPRQKEDFHYSYPLKAGGKLELENFNGSVEITGWDRNEVQIDGTKYAGSPEALSALKVEVLASADSVRIRTVRPSDSRGNLGAKYVILAPRKLQLDRVVSSNGAI